MLFIHLIKVNVMETETKKCIYVLEDNANIADIIEFLLTEEDYTVEVCKNANSFWQKMEEHTPDMIVLDVLLPDANGVDICLSLKRNIRTHRIPVLMMSGNNHLNKVKAKCDADSYINKPFDLNDFVQRIDYYSRTAF
ncbi:hypothetical protein MASR2M52_13180 [Pedobacter sp.]